MISVIAENEPRFDFWGAEVGGPIASAAPSHFGRLRAQFDPDSSWLNLAIVGVATVLLTALIVYFTTAGTPPVPGAPASTAATRAVANTVNLRAADVPGFHVANGGEVAAIDNPGAQFEQCFGTIYGTAAISSPLISSPAFAVGGGMQGAAIGSSVSIASDSQLASDSALATSPLFPQCFAQALSSITWTAPGVNVTGSNPTTATLPAPVAASSTVDPILAMRASTAWTTPSLTIPVTVDVYVVTAGHDELTLFAFAAGHPFSTAREQQLVSLLVKRALAVGA